MQTGPEFQASLTGAPHRSHHARRNLDWLLRKKPAVPRRATEAIENIAAARGRSTAPSCALDDARLWQVGETTGKPAKTVHYKRLRGRATGYALSESAKQLANPSLTVFTRWQTTQPNIYSQYQERTLENQELVCRKKRP